MPLVANTGSNDISPVGSSSLVDCPQQVAIWCERFLCGLPKGVYEHDSYLTSNWYVLAVV